MYYYNNPSNIYTAIYSVKFSPSLKIFFWIFKEVKNAIPFGTAPFTSSALIIFDRHANLKYKYGNRHFGAIGHFVDTVGKNEKVIKEYIRNQMQEDYISDQIGIEEYVGFIQKRK